MRTRWGYQRIVGELVGVGVRLWSNDGRHDPAAAGVSPAGTRVQFGWREFLRAHAGSIFACDLLTVGTLWLGCLYVLFLLELDSRRVEVAGCTANPDGRWTARQLAWVAARASDSGPLPDPGPREQVGSW